MKTISTYTFKHILKDVHKNTDNRKFCFILGAGASRKSGIPTGEKLAEKWFSEIKKRVDESDLHQWMAEEGITEENLAIFYGSIYRKRFEYDKISGYEALVKAMKDSRPTLGHIILAQILSVINGHCVITTNFDSLVESSVYQFTNKTPLVCGHEFLCGYARPSQEHPLIIKIHRDLLLAPKSDPDEINKLDPGWKEPLDRIFSTHIPIIIGYGGNDGSLMSYFETMNKPSNFFWCGLNEKNVSERIKNLITSNNGGFVKIKGFDELMYELLWVFDEIKPIKEELSTITRKRIRTARKQLEEIIALNNATSNTDPTKTETERKELSALEYNILAEKETDIEARKKIYLEALAKYPSTAWLWVNFTRFLNTINKDLTELDSYYQKALKLNESDPKLLADYTNFLKNIKKDYAKAEEYYLKGYSADPQDATNNCNYAIFLKDIKKDYTKAEEYYLKALTACPTNADCNCNYAIFLKDIKKIYPQAEEYYLKALEADPGNAYSNCNYAIYLKQIKKDYPLAEEYYLKALAADPTNAAINSSYARFLKEIENDFTKAEEYYLKAYATDPLNAKNNCNYAQMLLEKGEKKKAEKFIEKAFSSGPENEILIELWFYRYAHYREYLSEAETKIEELLAENIRSKGWNFDGNIKQAIREKHPDPEKLQEFARKISSEPQLDTLIAA